MKKMISLFAVALLSVTSSFAQTDAEIMAPWTFPIPGVTWFKGAVGIEPYVRDTAYAHTIADFDPETSSFDDAWNSSTIAPDSIKKPVGNQFSNHGVGDFDAVWKSFYDDAYLYILIKFDDNSIAPTLYGSEKLEISISPYQKLDNPTWEASLTPGSVWMRYTNFGGYKATFINTGYVDCMLVGYNAENVGSLNFNGTTEALTNGLFLFDRTEIGSSTAKWIVAIDYATLNIPARNLTFDKTLWEGLNYGQGLSFDLKIVDFDDDDELNQNVNPTKNVIKPAEYLWNSATNEVYQSTFFAGFLAPANETSVKNTKVVDSIFGKVSNTQVLLNKTANVEVFNTVGKIVYSANAVNKIDLSQMNAGVYIIRANNESMKFVR